MVRFSKLIIESVSFCIYVIVVLLLSLWFLFPADTLQTWMVMKLSEQFPSASWTIGEMRFDFPLKLTAKNIRIQSGNDENARTLVIQNFFIMPHWRYLVPKNGREFVYAGQTLGGTVKGRITLKENDTYISEGSISAIQMKEINSFFSEFDRDFSGKLSGLYTLKGSQRNFEKIQVQGELKIDSGGFVFRKPVLGLDRFDFSKLRSIFSFENNELKITTGTVESRLLSAEFTGLVVTTADLMESELQISGKMTPRSELFAVSNDTMLDQFIKKQLQNGQLIFSFSGTLSEPGIFFQENMRPLQGTNN